ncbi:CotO family spore coat protein [Neobacillus sp. OS1-2]|uniref:CotO family spore coat protein n=1 Tax=Neobacillus sp. OS1-2 TaxID=3070680 RepID=UPI0027E1BC6A|nr:CotO family spore coat protein [Neobacillus sp. OS1-2]WML38811.1 CotO family spore coat protein [Neobacillus sp. OS1-2]
MSKMKSRGPLLYVHQSFSRTPTNNNMQEVYTNRKEQETPEEVAPQGKETLKKISLAKKELFQEQIPIEIVKAETPHAVQQQQTSRPSLKRVKPFKEMELTERLDYLINFPKVLPPVPCNFYTVEGNYQGYLAEYNQHQVTITFHDQTSKTLPIEELKDVMMIGIKKV